MAMASNRRARPLLRLPPHLLDEVEKVYQITGTGMSSASQTEFDYKASEKIWEINDLDVVVQCDDFSKIVPEETHGDQLFLSNEYAPLPKLMMVLGEDTADGWRIYGSFFGHGISSGHGQYRTFKRTYVYYKDNQKTNWFMNTYVAIEFIKFDDIYLCHVFQSHGNYDPRPKFVPTFSAFDQTVLHSRAEELEDLIKNPNAFMDFDERDENIGAYSTRIANGSGKKRSKAWKDFTEIKVLGPDGVVVLTFAICHGCNIAYKTGSMTDSGFKNNGTKTLTEHSRKCNGKHHIAGNPKEAPHH